MMRACHLNTCPVGIATQDPELRKRFAGHSPSTSSTSSSSSPRRRARSWPGSGSRASRTSIGRVDLLEADEAIDHWKAPRHRPVRACCSAPDVPAGTPLRRVQAQDSPLPRRARLAADRASLAAMRSRGASRSSASYQVRNVNRTVGGLLSHARHEGARRRRAAAGDRSASRCTARPGSRSAPGSRPGSSSRSSATRTTTPARASPAACSPCGRPTAPPSVAEENVIVGNTVLYGATAGPRLLPRHSRASGSPCATRARTLSSKASATTAAST